MVHITSLCCLPTYTGKPAGYLGNWAGMSGSGHHIAAGTGVLGIMIITTWSADIGGGGGC